MEGQIRYGLLYSGGSRLSGQLTGAVCGRQLLARPFLKARPGVQAQSMESRFKVSLLWASWVRTTL